MIATGYRPESLHLILIHVDQHLDYRMVATNVGGGGGEFCVETDRLDPA